MNIFTITSTWKFNKNIRVMLSRKRRTLHLTGFAYICCIVDKTRSYNTKNVFCFCFLSFVCLFYFSSVNIFKVKLVVSFYLSVISDICEPCLGTGGGVSISRIPKTK
jgi:hypothetical protein